MMFGIKLPEKVDMSLNIQQTNKSNPVALLHLLLDKYYSEKF